MLQSGASMLYLQYLIDKYKLSRTKLSKYLNLCYSSFQSKLNYKLRAEFTIDELEKLKEYFVKLGLLTNDFDIGDFLNFVAEQ